MKVINEIFDIFEDEGFEIYAVGGFCRDLLSAQLDDDLNVLGWKHYNQFGGEPPKDKYAIREATFWKDVADGKVDVDFATNALPEQILAICQNAGFETNEIGKKFGTIQCTIGITKVEITTFRVNEDYTANNRHPVVKFGNDLIEDLKRRDLTINSLAMDKHECLIDPFHGQDDLIMGLLHTPIDPVKTFTDDPLRMLRACRFTARGYGSIGSAEGKAIEENAHLINTLSKERIFEEMSKLLCANHPDKGLEHLKLTGLLTEIFPEMKLLINFKTVNRSKDLWQHVVQVVTQTPPESVLRWSALFHDIGKPLTVEEDNETGLVTFRDHEEVGANLWKNSIAPRLKMSKEFSEAVEMIIRESGHFVELKALSVTDKSIRRFIRKVGPRLENIYQFSMADITSANEENVKSLKKRTKRLKERIDKIIEKDNIVELKLPSGFGNILVNGFGLKGKEVGIVMTEMTNRLIDGDLSLNDDLVVTAARIIEELKNEN